MDASERFVRFAAECELMVKFTPVLRQDPYGVAWRRDGCDVLNWSSGNTRLRTGWFNGAASNTRSNLVH